MTENVNISQSFLNKSRKDKFLLVLNLPKAFTKVYSDLTIREMQISIYGSPVPSVSIPSTEASYFGQQLKVTGQSRASYGPLNVSFTVDNEFKNYWTLWKWLDLINDSKLSGMNDYFDKYQEIKIQDPITKQQSIEVINKDLGESLYFDYMTHLTVYGLDEYNNKKIKFTYYNAFITDLAEISYNYRDAEELESSASFAFSQLHAQLLSEDC